MDAVRTIAYGLLLAGWCFSTTPALADKRVALIIGNSSYDRVAPLSNPAHDASLMADTFRTAGFDSVDLKRDLKINDMRRVLREFVDNAAEADIAVVYFAGHGIEVDGINYLVPVDAVLDRDRDVYDEALSLERVLVAVEPAKRLRLIILDACRDNPFTRSMKRTLASRAVGRGLAKVEPTAPNTLIAFASKAGSTASDGDGGNSPFTAALVSHVTRPGLDLRRAFGYVRDDVLKKTGNKQEPYLYGSLGGEDLPLVPAKEVPAPAKPVASESQTDPQSVVRRDYELALQVNTGPAWGSFLRQHPDGFYAELAKEQLEKLGAVVANPAPIKPSDGASDQMAKKPESRTDVASLTPTAPTPPNAISNAEIIRQLHGELSRVGCYAGPVDGNWRDGSQKSLGQFNKNVGLKLDVRTPSIDSLEAVKGKTSRVCPLICDRGYKVEGEACVRIVCGNGFQIGDGNTCEKIPLKKPIAKRDANPTARQEPTTLAPTAQVPAVKPQAAGRVMCDTGGCRAVPKGCQVVSGRTGGTDGRLVCN